MSLGLQYLYAICTTGARTTFFELNPEHLIEEAEQEAYGFIAQHMRVHGTLPHPDTCQRNGHPLVHSLEPVSYYVDRIPNRYCGTRFQAVGLAANAAFARRDMDTVHSELRNYLALVSRTSRSEDTYTMGDLADQVVADYHEAHLRANRRGITLGWTYLDDLTGGGEGGDVITLVARPNKGKSWLISKMAHAAWLAGNSVLLLSMEMTGKQMARRVIGLDAGMNPNYIREGRLSTWGEGAMMQTVENLRTGAPFHVIQGSFNKSLDAVDRAMELHNPDIVFIDASYLMAPSKKGNSGPKKTHEILAAVGTEMKEMSMSRNRPFVQTVQFNREAEKAEERTLAHIGGTDVVGQISTVVVGVNDGPTPYPTSTRQLDVLKNRENPLGSFCVNFMFNPPNFDFRPPEDIDPNDNGGVEAEWSM